MRASLEDRDFAVDALNEAKQHFASRRAVRGNTIPVATDHFSDVLMQFETLPFEASTPSVAVAPRRPPPRGSGETPVRERAAQGRGHRGSLSSEDRSAYHDKSVKQA
jgi:hypothetical protein